MTKLSGGDEVAVGVTAWIGDRRGQLPRPRPIGEAEDHAEAHPLARAHPRGSRVGLGVGGSRTAELDTAGGSGAGRRQREGECHKRGEAKEAANGRDH